MIYLILDCYKDWNTGGAYHDVFKIGHTEDIKKLEGAYDRDNCGYNLSKFCGPDELDGYLHYWFRDLSLLSKEKWFKFSEEAVDMFKYTSNPIPKVLGKDLSREEFFEVLRSYLLYLRNPLVKYSSGLSELLEKLKEEFKKHTNLEWEEDVYKKSFFCGCCEVFRKALQVWKDFNFSEVLKLPEVVPVSLELMENLIVELGEFDAKIEKEYRDRLENKSNMTKDLLKVYDSSSAEIIKLTLAAEFKKLTDADDSYLSHFIGFENDVPVFNTLVKISEEHSLNPLYTYEI